MVAVASRCAQEKLAKFVRVGWKYADGEKKKELCFVIVQYGMFLGSLGTIRCDATARIKNVKLAE